jgi:phosphoribosylaminoimidazole-succinocarboxamide synthase
MIWAAFLIIATDLSAFDVVLPTPINKGKVLTQMSAFWLIIQGFRSQPHRFNKGY